MKRRLNQGVTLVEVIVAALIMAVLASVGFVMFNMYNREFQNATACAQLHIQSETVSQEVARRIRGGSVVLGAGESWNPDSAYSSRTSSSIRILDEAGVQTGGFRVAGSKLQEYRGGKWQDFMCGSNPVLVDAVSSFRLSEDRRQATVDVNVTAVSRGEKLTFLGKGDTYRCRN